MELTSCPECGLVAEVVDRDVWPSTDGPVEHAHVRCAAGHRFVLPVESLARHNGTDRSAAAVTASRGAAGERHVRHLAPPAGDPHPTVAPARPYRR